MVKYLFFEYILKNLFQLVNVFCISYFDHSLRFLLGWYKIKLSDSIIHFFLKMLIKLSTLHKAVSEALFFLHQKAILVEIDQTICMTIAYSCSYQSMFKLLLQLRGEYGEIVSLGLHGCLFNIILYQLYTIYSILYINFNKNSSYFSY